MEDVAPLFATMLSIPSDDRYSPLTLSPQRRKDKTIEAVIDQVRGLSQQHPVLYIFEDVHWIHPTSLEVVDGMIESYTGCARVASPYLPPGVYAPDGAALRTSPPHTLNRLSRQQVATMVGQVTGGKALPQEVLDQIVTKTDGVPLFVEELTKTVLESGLLTEQWLGTLQAHGSPATAGDPRHVARAR